MSDNKPPYSKSKKPNVVVVTKKKFNFMDKSSKDLSRDSDVTSERKIESAITHQKFDNSARESKSIRNLDEKSIRQEKPEANETKITRNFTKGSEHKKDGIKFDFFNETDASKKEDKKVNRKDFLKDITIISDSHEKHFDPKDSSLFLGKSGKYGSESLRKRKNIFDDEEIEQERIRSIASIKRERDKIKRKKQALNGNNFAKEKKAKEVILPETITVQELANRMSEPSASLVRELMKMGMMITANKPIDADTAELLVSEFGMVVKRVSDSDIENILDDPERTNEEMLKPRAPVVSVMGHVDHGKTSLLDALRETNIVAKESGGITQHIGASKIIHGKNSITFLDTPGHEAFTAMRLRGAHATDMVILVVAADDGIKDQTIEAINHAKAANIPIIVAINKMDKDGANPDKISTDLLEHGVIVEAMGGDVLSVKVSAKEKMNLDKLLDAIYLQSEFLELKANPECKASGVVIESKIDKSKGVLSTLLVQHGTLKIGDIVVAGTAWGKVRILEDENKNRLEHITPAEPAELLGLNEAPAAGEKFYVVDSEKTARDIIEYRINKKKNKEAARKSKKTLEDIFAGMTNDSKKKLSIIVKADVNGSVEAINNSIEKLANEEVDIKIIHSAVGGITDSDIVLAKASDAVIVGFNVRISASNENEAKEVDIRYYSIIYDLVDDINLAVKGMLKPVIKEVQNGKGEIRKVFDLSKYGKIAGCYVNSGIVKRSSRCRIIRDSVVISDSAIKALKHFKDDVKEVKNATECGISFENTTDFLAGDKLEFFELIEESK
jgi:translation initiation factor IF-2